MHDRRQAGLALASLVLALGAAACASRSTTVSSEGPPAAADDRLADSRGVLLPTGERIEPIGRQIDVGNMPLAAVVAPGGRYVFLSLSGWREEGVQVVDRISGRVVQTLQQRGAFVGLQMTSDGHTLLASGGGADVVYRYGWNGERLTLADSIDIDAPGDHRGSRNVAGIALAPDGRLLYVAENVSDSLSVVDLAGRRVIQRIHVGHGPYQIATAPSGVVYVSSWRDSVVDALAPRGDGSGLRVVRAIPVVRHPSAMLLDPSGTRLFVASGSTDRVAVVDPSTGATLATLRDSIAADVQEGSTPDALALSRDGRSLYVAEADANAVAVFDLARGAFVGRFPVGWYPTALATLGAGDSLIVVNGKGRGTGPNPKGPQPDRPLAKATHAYTLGQLDGTLSIVAAPTRGPDLDASTARVALLDGWDRPDAATSSLPPIRHVILVIKENRTFDQVLSDLPGVDGDTTLQFFGRSISPNHHALAERFGAYDRFYTNAEVSAQGHPWSTAAYVTDVTEKTTPSVYSNRRMEPADDDELDPAPMGYVWNDAIAHGVSFRNYGEDGRPHPPGSDGRVRYGSMLPALEPYTDPDYPSFDLTVPDQRRVDEWVRELRGFEQNGNMPALETLYLPNDHTAGAKAGMHTPRALFADNDLALGRVIEALSHSRYWESTAVFVMEDDAQAGPDHVDSHRAVGLVISPWTRGGVVHRFVNTTDMLATIEALLHLTPMSSFDRFGRPLVGIWRSAPDLRPYTALVPAQSLDERNPSGTHVAALSRGFDLSAPDRIDDAAFNHVLWAMMKGERAYPERRDASALEAARER